MDSGFEVLGFSFDVQNPLDLASTGGGGAPKPSFSTLEVEIARTATLTALTEEMLEGRDPISVVQLLGIYDLAGEDQEVYDLRLGDALLVGKAETADTILLEFDFAQVSLMSAPLDNGAPGIPPATEFAWDRVFNTSEAVALERPQPLTSETPEAPIASYHLLLEGFDGIQRTFSPVPESYSVSGFESDILPGATFNSNVPVQQKPDFSALNLQVDLDTDIAALSQVLTNAAVIEAAQLIGLSSNGTRLVDLRMNQVFLESIADNPEANETVALKFARFDLVTRVEDELYGKLGPETSVAYDIANNTPDVAVREVDLSVTADPAGSVAEDPDSFFLLIEGFEGRSDSRDVECAFQVISWGFSIDDLVASTGSGFAPAGRPEFSDLTVTFEADAASAQLAQATVEGASIPVLQFIGSDNSGNRHCDLRLENVIITELTFDSDLNVSASFSLEEVELITANSIGSPIDGGSNFAWNLVANQPGDGVREVEKQISDRAPDAQNDAFATDEDTEVAEDLLVDNGSGVDSDPDGDALIVTEINGHGDQVVLLGMRNFDANTQVV